MYAKFLLLLLTALWGSFLVEGEFQWLIKLITRPSIAWSGVFTLYFSASITLFVNDQHYSTAQSLPLDLPV